MIMIGHYIGIVKYSTDISCFPFIVKICNSRFSAILDESFWLQLFFVVSGFLVSQSKIKSVKEFLVKALNRFLRLYLPILAACIIIFILDKIVGFHNVETRVLFTCNWYQSFFSTDITLLDLVIDPIKTVLLGGSIFNSPYWVIRDMFYSSIIIYCVNLLSSKIDFVWFRSILLLLLGLVFRFAFGTIYFACLLGAFCGTLTSLTANKGSKIYGWICVLCVILPFGLHSAIYTITYKIGQIIQPNFDAIRYLCFDNTTWGVLYFSIFVFCASKNKIIQRVCSRKILCELNKISFGIYSFHWPLMCSVGALVILGMKLKVGIILSWVLCVILTIVVSIMYHLLIEANINKILRIVRLKNK